MEEGMICPNCNSETNRIKYFSVKNNNGESLANCPYCSDKYQPKELFNANGVRVRGRIDGSKGMRTNAHDADISRRRLAPDGSVVRDYGRKIFC